MGLATLTVLTLLLAAADARQFSEEPPVMKSLPPIQRFRDAAADIQTAAATRPAAASPVPGLYKQILDEHNKHRADHGAPPLAWDDTVAKSAENATAPCVFQHSGTRYGENIFMTTMPGAATALKTAIDMWYAEVSLYSYSKPGFGLDTGHFTQVVWVGSKFLGCHWRSCPDFELVACQYDPPGNWMNPGEFEKNVLPKGTQPPAGNSPSPSPKPVLPSPSPKPPVAPSPSPLPGPNFYGSSLLPGDVLTAGTCLLSDNELYRLCVNSFGEITVMYGRSEMRVRWRNAMPLGDKTNVKRPYALSVTEEKTIIVEDGQGNPMMILAVPGEPQGTLMLKLRDDGKAAVIDENDNCMVAWGTGPGLPPGC